MGWLLLLGSAGAIVFGGQALPAAMSADQRKAEDSFFGDACLNRDVPLTFKAGSPYPDASFLGPMHWALRAKVECSGFSLRVRGLPRPSSRDLDGQRAASVEAVLGSFGLSSVRFVKGRGRDQTSPRIEIRVRA